MALVELKVGASRPVSVSVVISNILKGLRSAGAIAIVLNLVASPAKAGKFDGAMERTKYVVMTGDYNKDGKNDVLMKASSRSPNDHQSSVPTLPPVASPTFALLSTSTKAYTLVSSPKAALLQSPVWKVGAHRLVFTAATGSNAGSVRIIASKPNETSFVVAMDRATGALKLSSTLAPAGIRPFNDDPDGFEPDPTPVQREPGHMDNPDAGTLPGELTVTSGGAAAYSIPIVVPPGSAGVQPSITLSYTSSGTNGLLGLGWTLGGLSSIHRCGKTIAQDGTNDRISFAASDRLCLDGQRLVLTNLADTDDNYWAAGAQFRTEIDSMSRITANGSLDQRTFTVEAKDGKIMTYGTGSAQVAALSPAVPGLAPPAAKVGAQSWALDSIADRMNNRIRFEYTQDQATGEHRPSFIRYGNGAESHAAVEFIYQARTDRWKRYIDETRNDLVSRLESIKTHVGDNMNDAMSAGVMVREYKLQYEMSPTSGRSLLNSVQAFARHPDTWVIESMPATTFSWGKPDPDKAAGFTFIGNWAGAPLLTKSSTTYGNMHPEYFAFADFGNDGRSDVLEKQVAPIGGKRDPGEDGMPWGTLQTQYRYFHNHGSGFTAYEYRLDTSEPFVVLDVSDFNGDGSPDLVASSGDSSKICISPLGKPAGPGAPGTTIVFVCDTSTYRLEGNQGYLGARPYLVDVLGDGRTAHYAAIDHMGVSRLCIQAYCADEPAPPAVVPRQNPSELAPQLSATEYVSMSAMVDFTGIGKPYDVRWTKPYFVEAWYDDNGQTKIEGRWQNLTPTVSMTGFSAPGTGTAGKMANYVHAPYYPTPGRAPPRPPYIFDEPFQGGSLQADFSGSGYNSLAFGFRELSYPNSGVTNTKAEFVVCLSTGRALDCSIRRKYSGDQYRTIVTMGNFVGDGLPSILAQTVQGPIGGSPLTTGILEMCRIMGDDASAGTSMNDDNMVCEPWSGGVPMLGNNTYFMDLLGTGRMQMVRYRAGSVVDGQWQENGQWEVFVPTDRAVAGQALDRIYQVTNGIGAVSSVEYVDGLIARGADALPTVTQTGTTDLASSIYPQHHVANPGKVVRKLSLSTGSGNTRSHSYTYADGAVDVAGRGSLGFGSMVSIDDVSQLSTTTHYSHKWPTTGMVRTVTVKSSTGVILSETNNALDSKVYFHPGSGRQTLVPFVSTSTVSKRDLDGSDMGMVTTVNADYDAFFNLKEQTTTAVGANKSYITKTVTTYQNDAENWLIGLPTEVTVTKQDPDSGTGTRTVNYSYGPTGLLSEEIVEKDDPTMKLTATFGRDPKYGLVKTNVQKWLDPRTGLSISRTTNETEYDVKGRFPATVKNALLHSETHEYQAGTGARSSLVGPNALVTTWVSDGFGRVTNERRADGGETRSYTKKCAADCPSGAAVVQIVDTFLYGWRTTVPAVAYIDDAGHTIRHMTWGFNGASVVVDQTFDSKGRLVDKFRPRFKTAQPVLESRRSYDALDRVETLSTLNELGHLQSTATFYSGFVTRITNPRLQHRTETRNVIGKVTSVKDALNGITSFVYEPFGNLAMTTDPMGNEIKIGYDNRGRKTELNDPDLGRIIYSNDPVGRVWRQTSPVQRANGSATDIVYDALDRMISRADADLLATWVFDTAPNGVGQIASTYTGTDAVRDYQRFHEYDQFGRQTVVKEVLSDGNYYSAKYYDGFGRLLSERFKRGDEGAETRIKRRYNDYGYLQSVMRGSLVLAETKEQDAAGRATLVALGNGLSQKRTFDDFTGRLVSGTLLHGTEQRLQEGYAYDAIGSVNMRSLHWDTESNGFVELFQYDGL